MFLLASNTSMLPFVNRAFIHKTIFHIHRTNTISKRVSLMIVTYGVIVQSITLRWEYICRSENTVFPSIDFRIGCSSSVSITLLDWEEQNFAWREIGYGQELKHYWWMLLSNAQITVCFNTSQDLYDLIKTNCKDFVSFR